MIRRRWLALCLVAAVPWAVLAALGALVPALAVSAWLVLVGVALTTMEPW